MSNIPGLRTIDLERTCVACDDFPATVSFQMDEFLYRHPNGQVALRCVVPVWTCKGASQGCGMTFTDWRTEQIHTRTIEQYLNKTSNWVETPEEADIVNAIGRKTRDDKIAAK